MESIIQKFIEKGVVIPQIHQIFISSDVSVDQIESGVVLLPGTFLEGQIQLGSGTIIGPNAKLKNVYCGRNVQLQSGCYENCVFLDNAKTRSNAEIRGGSLLMDQSETSHTVGCKMTILGMKVVVGSVVNYCDVFVSGGTEDAFSFTEIGSGAIHYNFTPSGLKFSSLIGPGAVGEFFGLFPQTFIGGQTKIIAPVSIGSQVLIPAGLSVRQSVPSGKLYVESPLHSVQKNFSLHMLTSTIEKVQTTAQCILHYKALSLFFQKVRLLFAQIQKDAFLESLLQQAIETVQANINERMYWLFSDIGLFSKLANSEKIHVQQLEQTTVEKKVTFHLQEIAEHQALQNIQQELQQILIEKFPTIPLENEFIEIWKQHVQSQTWQDYFSCMIALSKENKKLGSTWLQSLIQTQYKKIQNKIEIAVQHSECMKQWEKTIQDLQKYYSTFQWMLQNKILLFDGTWDKENLGQLYSHLERTIDIRPIAWNLFKTNPIETLGIEKWERLLNILKDWTLPALIQWNSLLTMMQNASLEDPIAPLLQSTMFCFHGTDGLRGPTSISLQPTLKDAILHWIQTHEITPEFFESLARNTVLAWETFTNTKISNVLIGCDPRDIYSDNPQTKECFYQAILKGVLSLGKTVYDAGIIPIPCMPYTLAYYNYPYTDHEISIALYKSASHNPASQDGLKVFICQTNEETGTTYYSKLPVRVECIIAALLYKEAQNGFTSTKQGIHYPFHRQAREILRHTMWNEKNKPVVNNISFLVMDFAHGSFGSGEYNQSSVKKLVETMQIVGNQPNGKNINSNQGTDRVGAAHLENIVSISRQDIEFGNKFYGFPALDALFQYGKQHNQELQTTGSAWALFTDGDGDRSYVALYEPKSDSLHIIDGDEALFQQIHQMHYEKQIKVGDTFSFTVESSIPFIQALYDFLQQHYPTRLILSDKEKISDQHVNLKLCPVGDKHLLQWQCPGAESSGHILRKYIVVSKNNTTENTVYTGNGPLAGLHTVAAITRILQTEQNAWDLILHPYEKPWNTILYIYFVQKSLWYKESPLWKHVVQILNKACNDYLLTKIDFHQEQNTLYYIAKKKQETQSQHIEFAILARPSGTENKFGIKFYGSEKTRSFFQRVSEMLFIEIAPKLKDATLQLCQEEYKILEILQQQENFISLEDLKQKMFPNIVLSSAQNASFMSIIEAISEKAQNLAFYDGTRLKITPRGIAYLANQ